MPTEYVEMRDLGDETDAGHPWASEDMPSYFPKGSVRFYLGDEQNQVKESRPPVLIDIILSSQRPDESSEAYRERIGVQ